MNVVQPGTKGIRYSLFYYFRPEVTHTLTSPESLSSCRCFLLLLLLFILTNFYWRIVGSQCCVSFCYTAKSILYIYIYPFLSEFPSRLGHHRTLSRVPWAMTLWCGCVIAKSCLTLLWLHEQEPTRLLCPWDFPGKNTGVVCHFLLQAIFPTQGSNPSLLHCRLILYHWATRDTCAIQYYKR